MPTKAQFRMTLLVVVGVFMTRSLVQIWAHRHSTSTGLDGLVAETAQVAF